MRVLYGVTAAVATMTILMTAAECSGVARLGAWPASPKAQPAPTPTIVRVVTPPTPVQRDGKIALTVASEYPLSPDRATYEAMARATRENDRATLVRIAGQGRVTLVPNGTPVRVLETDWNLVRVEVSGGPMRGRSGWLPSNLVGP